MCATGALADARVELIDGELLEMNAQGDVHAILTVLLHRLLEQTYGAGHYVRDHSPLRAGEFDQPEPDLVLVRGEPSLASLHPQGRDVVLVVEIAVTTLDYDRAKAAVYARGDVPVYVLVNVEGEEIEVYRGPRSDGSYLEKRTLAAGDRLQWPERDDDVDAASFFS